MNEAYREAQALLAMTEHRWAAEAFELYLDAKDHLRLHPGDLSRWGRACLRAIREGSGGLLGNPPVM